tara:strand:- start:456 stop:1520 length:1065 start_codon:yes stop_codon:yes gene_type:complete
MIFKRHEPRLSFHLHIVETTVATAVQQCYQTAVPFKAAIFLTINLLAQGCSLLWWRTPNASHPPPPPPRAISIEREFQRVLALDDEAMQQIAHWLEESRKLRKTDQSLAADLGRQTRHRLAQVRKSYEAFLKRHPNHDKARAAFASFLGCLRDDRGALTQWNRALLSDDKNAAAWNNLATHYGSLALENGRSEYIKQSLNAYTQAIRCAPKQPLYHNNLAVALGLSQFKKEAAAQFQVSPSQLPELALQHFQKAHDLAPHDFIYAADLAEAYLPIQPLPKQEALAAWEQARKLTEDPRQIQWIELQLAFLEIEDEQYDRAENHLKNVTDPTFQSYKQKVIAAIQAARTRKPVTP